MADTNDQQGGTTGEPKTYDEAAVKQLVDAARTEGQKTGQTEAHTHWQSVTDKSLAALKKENEGHLAARDNTIVELRKAQLSTMSPEERSMAMLEDMRDMISGQGAKNASDKPQVLDPTLPNPSDNSVTNDDDAAAKQVAQIRSEVAKHLADTYGVDASKLDWADDAQGTAAVTKFIDSVIANQSKKEDPNQSDPNNVDTSHSPGGKAFDLKTTKPEDMIKSGAGQVRLNPAGGYSVAPFK